MTFTSLLEDLLGRRDLTLHYLEDQFPLFMKIAPVSLAALTVNQIGIKLNLTDREVHLLLHLRHEDLEDITGRLFLDEKIEFYDFRHMSYIIRRSDAPQTYDEWVEFAEWMRETREIMHVSADS